MAEKSVSDQGIIQSKDDLNTPGTPNKICPKCSEPCLSDLILCASCSSGFHRDCINMRKVVDGKSYKCRACRGSSSAKPTQSKLPSSLPLLTAPSGETQNLSKTQTNDDGDRFLESLDSLNDKQLSSGQTVTPPQNEKEKLNEDSNQTVVGNENQHPNSRNGNDGSSISICSSKSSTSKRKQLALRRIEEEYELQRKRDAEYLERKYRILQENSSSEEEFDPADMQRRIISSAPKNPESVVQDERTKKWVKEQGRVTFDVQETQSVSRRDKSPVPNSIPYMSNTSQKEFLNSTTIPMANETNDTLAASIRQLASRQGATDLPIFEGDPTEWPSFISCYIRSNRECHYTDSENFDRLKKSIRGRALKAVKNMMVYPETLNQLLDALRMKYGRPNLILNATIKQVRKEPKIDPDRLETLVDFSSAVQYYCAILEVSKMKTHINNPQLLEELLDKLPGLLKLNWGLYIAQGEEENLISFSKWLQGISLGASKVSFEDPVSEKDKTRHDDKFDKFRPSASRRKPFRSSNYLQTHSDKSTRDNAAGVGVSSQQKAVCKVCSEGVHNVVECKQFISLSKKERWECMRSHKLCRKCLGNHHVTRCRSFKDCGVNGCTFKHHYLLHDPSVHSQPSTSKSSGVVATTVEIPDRSNSKIHFRVLPVVLKGPAGSVKTFAFLDDGSSLTLIEESLAEMLELEGPASSLNLQWTSNTTRCEPKSRRVSLDISGVETNSSKFHIENVRTVKSLDLPMQSLHVQPSKHKHLRGLSLQNYGNVRPRILIGLPHIWLTIPQQVLEGGIGDPVATNTRLGWTIFGSFHHTAADDGNEKVHHISESTMNSDESLHKMVQEFFTTENVGVMCPKGPIRSSEEKRAYEILDSTTTKIGEKYVTGLLWRFDKIELPNSYSMAFRRLLSLERRMAKDRTLSRNLHQQIKDYQSKGYARKLSPDEVKKTNDRTWYLPVFCVNNPNKPGKTRLVWDAAAECNGVSLNSVLLKGPDLLVPLADILQRFREQPIAVTADIREMFHRVGILEEDQHSQRFIWRDNPSQKPDVFVMCVMTFGASCSPSCAQYVKNLNASRYEFSKPRAYRAIRENHYVDDWLDGFATVSEATDVIRQVIDIHKEGGFEIRNFTSNSSAVLQFLGCSSQSDVNVMNMGASEEIRGNTKVLGMWWSTKDDCFYYSLNTTRIDSNIVSAQRKPTKREVLRIIMMTFDPLGLIAAVIVYAKILIRDIWKSGTGWDDQIPDELFLRWKKWISFLPKLTTLRVPRCYSLDGYTNVQLHIFTDASVNAFAAVGFFRIESPSGIHCRLVSAKTKVSPQKIMSIPRLELQGAVLGARLANSIAKSHSISPTRQVFWTDSADVLAWLRSEDKTYRQFVAFRVNEILETTNRSNWRWVPTLENIADIATKWQNQPDLSANSRWFTGPEFLYNSEEFWPVPKQRVFQLDGSEEVASLAVHSVVDPGNSVPDVSRFSKWRRFLRTTAWVLRIIHRGKSNPKAIGELTVEEINAAEKEILRSEQSKYFSSTISSLKIDPNAPLAKDVNLYKLTPFLDSDGILRLKGRANRSKYSNYDTINPIILPYDSEVTRLIVKFHHEKFFHQNHETVLNDIRQRFAIPKLRVLARSVRAKCQSCKNESARPIPPIMGDHPNARVAAYLPAFSYVGLDYFGPVEVVKGRHVEKRWIALFTCLTIRAIHIEIVQSLTTKSCMMAISNFIALRGRPIEIRSDNATNFKGACKELRRLFAEVKSDDYRKNYDTIKWVFNTPLSPHQGGCWEVMVRSVKRCVNASMPTRRPDDETLRCFLMEAVSVVNSRPLTFVPVDPDDDTPITPNTLLLGSSNGSKPLTEFNPNIESLVTTFEKAQRMADVFWKRWLVEYLPIITRTTKWFQRTRDLKIGDVVVIMEDKARNSWRRGRIIDVLTGGRRNQVRQVTIKTIDGIYSRSPSKVAVLDLKDDRDCTPSFK